MTRKVTIYLQDILDNIALADRFTTGLTYDQFAADNKTAYAVVRSLEVIGEAAKSVPADVRKRFPSVPWKDMAGMRDRLIHAYFGVSYEKVWRAVKDHLPAIKPFVEQALRDMKKDGPSLFAS